MTAETAAILATLRARSARAARLEALALNPIRRALPRLTVESAFAYWISSPPGPEAPTPSPGISLERQP